MKRSAAAYYDAIYTRQKDYAAESAKIDRLIRQHGIGPGARLLDVACGTGLHLSYLRAKYDVEGVDVDDGMLAVARGRLDGVPLRRADMEDFDLGRAFDVVTCLFSAIGYARTIPRLRRAIAAMARHLRPGGLLLVEPWITPMNWRGERGIFANLVDEPELKIARLGLNVRRGRLTTLNVSYLIATNAGFERYRERLVLRLFTHEEYVEALEGAGFLVAHDPDGLMGRGLYIGTATRR